MSIKQTFEVIAKRLPEAGVDFLMIGGHAVNVYGYVRATMDVDFMIAAEQVSAVREMMKASGFTNVSESENVIFFSRPDSALRVDFLSVDTETMSELISRASSVDYAGSSLRIPCLEDLISMKLFALKNGHAKRQQRDSEDVVKLVLEHQWNLEEQLRPLCLRFADEDLYAKLAKRIEGEKKKRNDKGEG